MNLVFFDFDYIFIFIDSDYEWGCFFICCGVVDEVEYQCKNDQFYVDYKVGMLDIYVFLCFVLVLFVVYLWDMFVQWYVEFMYDVICLKIILQV